MSESLPCTVSAGPIRDTAAPTRCAGEKDACGVGFLAQLSGEASHWVMQQALRGLAAWSTAVVAVVMGIPVMAQGSSADSLGVPEGGLA